jgi:hypothetical protein
MYWRTDSMYLCTHGSNIMKVAYCSQFRVFFLLVLFALKDVFILKIAVGMDTRNRKRKPHGKTAFFWGYIGRSNK